MKHNVILLLMTFMAIAHAMNNKDYQFNPTISKNSLPVVQCFRSRESQPSQCLCYATDRPTSFTVFNHQTSYAVEKGKITIKDSKGNVVHQWDPNDEKYCDDIEHLTFNRTGTALAVALHNSTAYVWQFQNNTIYPLEHYTRCYPPAPLDSYDVLLGGIAAVSAYYLRAAKDWGKIPAALGALGGISALTIRRKLTQHKSPHLFFLNDQTIRANYNITAYEWKLDPISLKRK